MKYALVVKEEAQEDIRIAYLWYEDKLNGLGEKFFEEMDNCISYIIHNPFIYEVRYKDVRYGIMNTFPYVVIYRIEKFSVIVYAVFNTRKNPKSWRGRLK